MRFYLNKKKSFKYVDYIHIGNYDLAPLSTSYGKNSLEVIFEANEDETNGQVQYFINDPITEVQLCGDDDEEILLHGREILDYFDFIWFDDMGYQFEYNVKAHLLGV